MPAYVRGPCAVPGKRDTPDRRRFTGTGDHLAGRHGDWPAGPLGIRRTMWFALATPVVVMIATVLMERFERYCDRAEAGARVRVPEPRGEPVRPVSFGSVVLRH
ncbi:hypothetical protein [Amycolatopsis panacis]|uniref:Uncharacterized protein n=1 Tax=Amycolatopsis panacis TaxID=2340917 RepID=A0A419I7S0_9PSEU|nr:hypothetical protein [Amycolatopsis panacis]RJQ87843.1 hypothetical protein D5S19_08545 [Amycolatopsis panacis]